MNIFIKILEDVNVFFKSINFELLESTILAIGFSLYFLGIIGFALNDFKAIFKGLKKERTNKKPDTKLEKHFRMILSASDLIKYISPKQFKFTLMAIFMVSSIVTIGVFEKRLMGTAVLLSITLSSLPYILIRVKLTRISNKASHEAEVLINDFILKYKLKDENIVEAIEGVIQNPELKYTKPMLSRLLMKIRTTQNKEAIKEAIDVFTYSIGTTWGKILGINIYHAVLSKINVGIALRDLSENLKVARKLWEEQARNTAEPKRMIWLSPITSVLLTYFAVFKSGLTINELIHNQFFTMQGLTLFILIVISLAISIISIILIFSKKFDI